MTDVPKATYLFHAWHLRVCEDEENVIMISNLYHRERANFLEEIINLYPYTLKYSAQMLHIYC